MGSDESWQLRCAKCSATGILVSWLGVLAMVLVGVVAWPVVRGVNGLLLSAASGLIGAVLLRSRLGWRVSRIAGFLGAGVAGFAALASAEVWEPGSWEWALKGGLYGGGVGVFVGALLGLLALGQRSR